MKKPAFDEVDMAAVRLMVAAVALHGLVSNPSVVSMENWSAYCAEASRLAADALLVELGLAKVPEA